MIPKYIESLPFIMEFLKNDILVEHNLSWTEYLVLCLVHQLEQNDIQPTPHKIISTSGKNRCWIYRAIRKLKEEEGHIYVAEGKYFEPGRLFITPLGNYTLRRINSILVKRIRRYRIELTDR